MSVTPIFRTPFTDLSSATLNYETIKQCRPFYVQYAKCQEAWGGSQFPSRCRYIFLFSNNFTIEKKIVIIVFIIDQSKVKHFYEQEIFNDTFSCQI